MKVLAGRFSESLTAFWATTNSESRSQGLYVASEALGTENLESRSHYCPGGISSFPTLLRGKKHAVILQYCVELTKGQCVDSVRGFCN